MIAQMSESSALTILCYCLIMRKLLRLNFLRKMSLWSIRVLKQRNSAEGVNLRRRSTLLAPLLVTTMCQPISGRDNKKAKPLKHLNIELVAKSEEGSALFTFSNYLVFYVLDF